MSFIPPVVDQLLNISFHALEGLAIPVTGQLSGVEEDLSQRNLVFRVLPSRLTKNLALNPNNPKGRMLLATADELSNIPATGADFVLMDYSNAMPFVRWEGRIIRRGG